MTTQDLTNSDYRTLFDELPLPLWLIGGASLKVIHANRAAVRLLGHNAGDCRGMTVKHLRERLNGAVGRFELLHTGGGTPYSVDGGTVLVGFFRAREE